MGSRSRHRRSIRLEGYDYSKGGCYFIAICTKDKTALFGHIDDLEMDFSKIGHLAYENWLAIPEHYPKVKLDEFTVMPNHIHGLIWLLEQYARAGAQNSEPLPRRSDKKHEFQKIIPKSIGSIVRAYKASIKCWCNLNGVEEFYWQRNFHERIIRNEKELNAVRQYIRNNSANRDNDEYNI